MAIAQESLSGRERALIYLRAPRSSPTLACPGSFVNEQQIATRVGVSRTPVREALLILGFEGLVQMIPKRGTYISPLCLVGKSLS